MQQAQSAQQMQDIISRAIHAKQSLKVRAKHLERIVDPYALYPTQDDKLVLESWSVEGEYEKTPPPHWYPIPLADLTSVTLLDRSFQPRPDYKPNSKRYQRAICRV